MSEKKSVTVAMTDLDKEDLTKTPGTDIEQPDAGASFARKSRARSVFFSRKDAEQAIPSLPVLQLIEHLTRRHGKTAYAQEFIRCVEEADENGDGLISIPELVHVIENMHDLKKDNTNLKKALGVGGFALVLVLCAIFGLVFAVVKLTKELETGGNGGTALVSTTTGIIVDTHPSDGGGIFLNMGAFTEPINITFPNFGKTQVCVGQISADQIVDHYNQFTTGGSDMTISYIDYSQDSQPSVFTHIPASNLEVTGFALDPETGAQAQEATQAIIDAQMESGLNRRRRLQTIMPGSKPPGTQQDNTLEGESSSSSRQDPEDANSQIKGSLQSRGSTGKSRRRFLQVEDDELVTVDDYMKQFAMQNIDIAFTKDSSLTDQVYFVCRDAEPTASG